MNPSALTELPHLVRSWSDWMLASSMSSRTIGERVRILESFAQHTGCNPAFVTHREIISWLNSRELGTKSSKSSYVGALRAFYRWCIIEDLRVDDPTMKLPKIRVPRAVPRPVSTDELSIALNSGRFYSRTRTMILLAAFLGLRVHEIAKFRGEDILAGNARIYGKGGVDANLPLHPVLAAEAELYPRIGYWFTSPNDRTTCITSKNVSAVVSKALHRAGVPATAHQLRHWYGTELLERADNIRTVQELLRHAQLSTVQIYTKVKDEQRRAAIDSLPVPLYAVGTRRPRSRQDTA